MYVPRVPPPARATFNNSLRLIERSLLLSRTRDAVHDGLNGNHTHTRDKTPDAKEPLITAVEILPTEEMSRWPTASSPRRATIHGATDGFH